MSLQWQYLQHTTSAQISSRREAGMSGPLNRLVFSLCFPSIPEGGCSISSTIDISGNAIMKPEAMWSLHWTVAVVVVIVASGQASQETIQKWADDYNSAWAAVKDMAEHNATVARMFVDHLNAHNTAPDMRQIPYECNLAPSPSIPTTAHALRPGDIKVVGSIGDSITAGYGITAVIAIEVLLNDRQESWFPGGQGSLDTGVMTVTNMLRHFNPSIEGYSYAESWAEDREAGLNVAVGGSIAEDLYNQAQMLVNKMRDQAYNVDWANDWKMFSVFIGVNDLCRACNDPVFYSPENYARNIQRAIDYLYQYGPPRIVIIIANVFDLTPLPLFSDSLFCDIFQGFACGCVEYVEETKERQRQYVAAVKDMLRGRYDNPERPDFTVVLMNHLDDATPPLLPGSEEVDRSYWSPDCFHPGRKAHYAIATSQWNQLFEPVGQKRSSLDWSIATDLVCPTEGNPFVYTNLNSGLQSPQAEVNPVAAEEDREQGQAGGASVALITVGAVVGVIGLLAIVALVIVKKTNVSRKLTSVLPMNEARSKSTPCEPASPASPAV